MMDCHAADHSPAQTRATADITFTVGELPPELDGALETPEYDREFARRDIAKGARGPGSVAPEE